MQIMDCIIIHIDSGIVLVARVTITTYTIFVVKMLFLNTLLLKKTSTSGRLTGNESAL